VDKLLIKIKNDIVSKIKLIPMPGKFGNDISLFIIALCYPFGLQGVIYFKFSLKI